MQMSLDGAREIPVTRGGVGAGAAREVLPLPSSFFGRDGEWAYRVVAAVVDGESGWRMTRRRHDDWAGDWEFVWSARGEAAWPNVRRMIQLHCGRRAI